MAGNGTRMTIPATIARLWATISGSTVIPAGVGTDSRNGGPVEVPRPILANTGRSGSPARTAVSLSPSSVTVMGSHWANLQLDGFHRPCRPVYLPPEPEKVAIKVPGGSMHRLRVTWSEPFATTEYEPAEPEIVTTAGEP